MKDGQQLNVPIESFQLMADIGPVIVQQLKNQGVEASYSEPPDFFDRFQPGDYNATLFGHGGSVANDPYDTLALYTGSSKNIPGGHAVNFSRWANADFDAVVDEMAFTSPAEADTIMDQWMRAMAIWLPELPDIPIQEWYHRIPMNQTYWTGWPTRDDSVCQRRLLAPDLPADSQSAQGCSVSVAQIGAHSGPKTWSERFTPVGLAPCALIF